VCLSAIIKRTDNNAYTKNLASGLGPDAKNRGEVDMQLKRINHRQGHFISRRVFNRLNNIKKLMKRICGQAAMISMKQQMA